MDPLWHPYRVTAPRAPLPAHPSEAAEVEEVTARAARLAGEVATLEAAAGRTTTRYPIEPGYTNPLDAPWFTGL